MGIFISYLCFCFEGTVPNKQNRSQMTFRECLEKCVAKNYHGTIPSPVCSFSREATIEQTRDGAPVKVNPTSAVPIYGQMASYDELFPADDVRRTSRTSSRVIRRIKRERIKDPSSKTTSHEDYTIICRTCISVTCFPFILHGTCK